MGRNHSKGQFASSADDYNQNNLNELKMMPYGSYKQPITNPETIGTE